ncbi:NAD-dependent succinate-semialdehyde dehydrogenase [Ponticoccus sp. SC2-23]|uniref:NAD-dependent succinate-semialdehyde dehydrogenase n=1 Tax=Alexandriicola marinus TaxID=2081710 RepID=UPI000FDB6148|nr:NAD-dependent succinate-semialdehyde dehydrogenase [Alexandriicola marinus]MBM1223046.1 NAD-dependent succinate-semialdehyde dehydrogenase [Ponticoccus sp. SC6-9]MBM1227489.1 NAD-dependent succinate-semialdehyde dehydrogenase [Ponticoccus sp. SC6-15]MBM1227516.1 NAD-dependent succinate-semialdehyde dehydrogenase [Ponticoccus sp. SC6-38]MBM1234300.1 NAD-dependent succinate-semialdehyde dehydrogenase [Ponticoccus sp. SC6-45]MBM1238018.1 NAD-dependent succinate-semialdehyde dehydrogenase [Pont
MDYTDLYIDGQWRATTERFDVINPATEEVLASVASADIADADAALDAAERAMADWAARTPRARSEVLRKAWELMSARLDHFANLITLENGKAGTDAKGEAAYAAEFFRWFAEEAVRADGLITHAPASGARIMVQHKPAGLAVLVTPWNYPAAMGTRKIAPALAAGCGVIIKPASETPLTMLALMPLLEEAGVPPGLVNVLPSRRTGALVDHMMHDPRVRVISFTGSTGVGRTLLKGAADQVLKPAMELGGNAPVVVFEDADMDVAIEGTMLAKMRNLGEACTAANRIYVHEDIADAFTARLTEKMSALKVGNGTDPSVDVGPLVNAQTRDKVAEFVADAVAKGAKVECGGTTPNGPGFFYPPTVLSGVPETADCVHDEIFGPVAAIQTFKTQEEVIARANDTEYGLVAYVFSGDFKRALQVCERLDYGMVGLNRGLVSDPAAPFGGTKQSGLGREGGHEGMLEFMETQYISASW